MKLKTLAKNPTTWLQEFDFWITPYLDDVKDSSIFIETRSRIKQALELVGGGNNQFSEPLAASPDHITDAIIKGIAKLPKDQISRLIYAVFDLLFLVTGRTDNNLKCQFPVYLREILGESVYPSVTKKDALKLVTIPRILSSERMALTISALANHQEHQRALLYRYIKFILNEATYINSLCAIGQSYFLMKHTGAEDEFLLPLLVSFVRGSASAVGGHKPENHLRALMANWGLTIDEDFNREDVIPYKANGNSEKTRAYDFILPYQVKGWAWRIFIQSQFYAGDSGSVSHKNIDQTKTSRAWVKQHTTDPLFVEYVDGAGYYGSLNGDLKSLLSKMPDTTNFFQYRTSPIKLRQLLQSIGFLTPLELAHALSLSNLDYQNAVSQLNQDGYAINEINRVITKAENLGLICATPTTITFDPAFRITARRYILLDGIANHSALISYQTIQTSVVLIPGYEHHFGLSFSEVGTLVIPTLGYFGIDWSDPAILLSDIDFLTTQKWIVIAGGR